MKNGRFETLFLCTGNSCRSIIAEALLQRHGPGGFIAYSAGSQPRGLVNPLASRILMENNHPIDGFHSKSWDEFAHNPEVDLDFVITVCDNAANEPCPTWPGQPMTAHWGIEDPDRPDLSEVEQLRLMKKIYWELDSRIKLLVALPLDKLDKLSVQRQLQDIGTR